MKSTTEIELAIARAAMEGRVRDSRTGKPILSNALLEEAKASAKIDLEGPVRTVCLVMPEFIAPATWRIPLVTKCEVNKDGRDWRARSRRSGAAWRAISRAIGPHLVAAALASAPYHQGKPIRVVFTRLGGRNLDKGVNLPSSLKATEDALCHILGCDDGSPLWLPSFEQRPGGPVGVEITIRSVNGDK